MLTLTIQKFSPTHLRVKIKKNYLQVIFRRLEMLTSETPLPGIHPANSDQTLHFTCRLGLYNILRHFWNSNIFLNVLPKTPNNFPYAPTSIFYFSLQFVIFPYIFNCYPLKPPKMPSIFLTLDQTTVLTSRSKCYIFSEGHDTYQDFEMLTPRNPKMPERKNWPVRPNWPQERRI